MEKAPREKKREDADGWKDSHCHWDSMIEGRKTQG